MKRNTVKIRNAYVKTRVQNVAVCVVFGEVLILCIRRQSAQRKTRQVTTSWTRKVLARPKNQNKTRIKHLGDQRDKGECRDT